MSEDNPKSVRCPCLGCGFRVWMNYGPKSVRINEKQALAKLIEHIENEHTIKEIFEWLERCAVEYFHKELEA